MDRIWHQSYDAGVQKTIDFPHLSAFELLDRAALKNPTRTALIFYGRKISYLELQTMANQFASALLKFNIKKGDRIALILPNCPEFAIAYYAGLKIGAIVVPTNPMYSPRELEFQLKDCGAETLVILDLLYNKFQKTIDKTDIKTRIITSIKDFLPLAKGFIFPIKQWFEHVDSNVEEKEGIYFFKKLLIDDEKFNQSDIDLEDIAILQYTGGTTGTSKGVMLTHKNLIANAHQVHSWFSVLGENHETVLMVLPLFHIFALSAVFNFSILSGSSIVLLPQFKVKEVFKSISQYKVTLLPAVPSMFIVMNNSPQIKKSNLDSLKLCISGGAALPVEVLEKFESLTSKKIFEGYGLSEASPATHWNPLSSNRKISSIGLPLPGTDIKIVKGKLFERSMPPGQVGELLINGPQVMKGYWNKPNETKNVLNKGWLSTGDIAVMDEQGFCKIIDRKKEMIIVGGNNVYPREIEEVLYEKPEIKEAAVIGLPDKSRGEYIKAFVVLKDGTFLKEEDVIKYCKEHLSHIKVPRKVEFKKDLPKSLIGKILKRTLKEEELKKHN